MCQRVDDNMLRRLPDIVVDDDADVVHLSSLFFDDDANFPGTQLVLFFDFQSFIVPHA